MRIPRRYGYGMVDFIFYHTKCDYHDVFKTAYDLADGVPANEHYFEALDQHLQEKEGRTLTKEDRKRIHEKGMYYENMYRREKLSSFVMLCLLILGGSFGIFCLAFLTTLGL